MDLEREALLAAFLVVYSCGSKRPEKLPASPLTKVRAGGFGLAFPDDEVEEERGRLPA